MIVRILSMPVMPQCGVMDCTELAFYRISKEDGRPFQGKVAVGWHSFSVCAKHLAPYLTSIDAGNPE